MHRVVLLAIDLVLVALSTFFALILRDNLEVSYDRFEAFLPYLLVTLGAAVPVLLVAGLNRTLWRFSALADFVRIALAAVAIVALAVALGFAVNRLEGVARAVPILQAILMVGALCAVRVAMRLRHAARKRAPAVATDTFAQQATVLLIGVDPLSELFLRCVDDHPGNRVKVVGVLGRGERHVGRLLHNRPILGVPEELEKVLGEQEVHGISIDRIVIAMPFNRLTPVAQEALLRVERTTDIAIDFLPERVVEGGFLWRPQQASADLSSNRPFALDVETLAARPYFQCKRALDAVVAGVGLGCAAPFILIVGEVVVLVAGWPPLFWQQRPGLKGQPFRLYKFRSMRAPHDRHRRRVADEHRHSRVGNFLRRFRLDELPQLYNILVGQMSFVGPRPLLPVDQMPGFGARLAVRPGLTGWAQIKGGRELTASDKAALDIWYVKHASLRLDLQILLGTVRMVLRGERTDAEAIQEAWRELGVDRLKAQAPPEKSLDAPVSHLRKNISGEYEGQQSVRAPSVPSAQSSARKRA